jgi:putative phosphoribosyl transferase
MVSMFRNRADAGRLLVRQLKEYANRPDLLVLGLPRGGVPVAFEVARALKAPLDIFLVRKLGVPGHEELAMGAIASGDVRILNDMVVSGLNINDATVEWATEQELKELKRRERQYRGDNPGPELKSRTVILVDDGLATGTTMRAAAIALRQQQPARIIVAVPVAALETCDEFRDLVDAVVCPVTPRELHAVGLWYENFSQTSDDEVCELLERSRKEWSSPGRATSIGLAQDLA